VVSGCTTVPDRVPVPERIANDAAVSGFQDIRLWGDDEISPSEQERWNRLLVDSARRRGAGVANYLVISGGGGDGAFSAGFLAGWSEAGTRPSFDVVTGISIGALVAPYAFIGEDQDDTLRTMFDSYNGYDFYARDNIQKVITGQLKARDNPLRKLVEKRVDDALLDAVAEEHRRGRLLFVGTTNLDAQRVVMWNLGAIAASRRPDRRALFVDVLSAAASIPVVLPAVPITVTAEGRAYEELHVDAGTQMEAVFLPAQISVRDVDRALGRRREHRLYILRNDKVTPQYAEVNNDAFDIARRSLSTLLKAHAVADLYRIHAVATRDRISYNLASIPANAPVQAGDEFNPGYLRQLFTLGESLARDGYSWRHSPPGLRRAK